jgi:geranylgeranyl pyrophosphate synthase/predicted secreted hydrolase
MLFDESDHHDDWPSDESEISLDIHDLPHSTSNIEWWYCNGHLTDSNHNHYSIFASFFRTIDNYRSTSDQIHYLHALTWAIIDIKNHQYYTSSSLDHQFISRILNGSELVDELDKHLFLAYQEIFHKNQIPLPDQLFQQDCRVDLNQLYLNYDNNIFSKDQHGNYYLYCHDRNQNLSFEFEMQPLKSVCRQAHNGIVNHVSNQESMFYYFIPRLNCQGKIIIHNQSIDVHGHSWYDHEFGGRIKYQTKSIQSLDEPQNSAWYWFSIQLNNQYDLTFTYLFDSNDHSLIDKSVLIIGPNNERLEYYEEDQIELQPLNKWFSVRTGCVYSTQWKIIIPKIQCQLILEAAFDNQEFLTILSRPSFWEGRLNVHGQMNDQFVHGYAFFECHGTNINIFKSLDQFFKRISQIVINSMENILPRQPTYEQAVDLIANQENQYLLNTLNLHIFSKTILSPLRDMIDRGGKAWRSFIYILCIDCVGGDSRKFEHWLSFPEILHVGSLMIDDIQDQSDVRRGGPACHLLHGIAQTINAGTAAYFLPLHSLIEQTPDLTTEMKLKMYESIFFTLRAAHVGQGLDIYGLDYLMNDSIETGDSLPLEQAILCIHRLKSGVPAGSLARMGAMIGGGTKEQCDVLEKYVQSLGIAFQIIDDVLNLRGFENDAKQRGEDIMAGKITFPIAKAMNQKCLNDKQQRQHVWNIIKTKTTDMIKGEKAD